MKKISTIRTLKPLLANRYNLINEIKFIDKNRYYSNYGPLYYKLKSKFENFLKLKKNRIIFSSSGHSSLLACCIYLRNISKKKNIIVPSFCYYSDVQAIILSGFKPIFIDIDINDLSVNENMIKNLTKKFDIAGIIFVSPFGFPISLTKLNSIKKKFSIEVIYDAADTFINLDKSTDKSNILITCSFHPTKSIPGNESGLIICNKKIQKDFESILNFGFLGKERLIKYIGFNGKFSEYDAAILNANFKNYYKRKKLYKDKINYFINLMKNFENIRFQNNFGKKWIGRTILIIPQKKINYISLKKKLEKKRVAIYKPWTLRPIHKEKVCEKFKRTSLKNTEFISNNSFAIPLYLDQSNKELKYISEMIKKFL